MREYQKNIMNRPFVSATLIRPLCVCVCVDKGINVISFLQFSNWILELFKQCDIAYYVEHDLCLTCSKSCSQQLRFRI